MELLTWPEPKGLLIPEREALEPTVQVIDIIGSEMWMRYAMAKNGEIMILDYGECSSLWAPVVYVTEEELEKIYPRCNEKPPRKTK